MSAKCLAYQTIKNHFSKVQASIEIGLYWLPKEISKALPAALITDRVNHLLKFKAFPFASKTD